MSKGIIKAAVLALTFVFSIILFTGMMNHSNEDLTTEMAEATLPVITLYENGTAINELHGYSVEMDAAFMRDTITPIAEDRILPITVQTFDAHVDGITYEIRSLDAVRLIADAKTASFDVKKGQVSAELKIQNLLEEDKEYLLIIKLEIGDKTVYYYTRIMESTRGNVAECVQFALDFNRTTFNDETVGTLATYMEKMTDDNTSLHFVSLHSSLKQIGWADFKGEKRTEPVPSIKEMTDTYNVICLEYVLSSIGENGEIEYYNVEEYYRVRYTENRMYLLNFERTMEQIFRGENNHIFENQLFLGIRSDDIEYKSNETGTCVAFVQEGELWSYHQSEATLAKVFSFRGYEGIEGRENYGEHDIKIVRVDENGSVDYIVYGYMNRGIHEGQVGIMVYHYDSTSNTNEEEVFIPSTRSFEVMRSELGQLMYVNEAGELFLMVDGSIYGIDLQSLKVRELVKGLRDDEYAVSASNGVAAWCKKEEAGGASVIHIMRLSDGTTSDIAAANGEEVQPLGFMGEDFVYGIAHQSDIAFDAAGNRIFPMYQVRIMDVTQEEPMLLKSYQKNGYFIAGIDIDGYTMYLERIQYNGTSYVEADLDMIMNREGDGSPVVSVSTVAVEVKETVHKIILPETSQTKAPKLLTPKETILENDRTVVLKEDKALRRYYVYVKGDVICATDNVTEAIKEANDNMGVVIAEDLSYVWKRSRKSAQAQIMDVAKEDASVGGIALCLNTMLLNEGININVDALIAGGETPKSILTNTMKDAVVYDLTGCDVEEVLYYVSCGSPVFAMKGAQEPMLILGYDASNIIVYDPGRGSVYRKSIENAREEFELAGNIYFTYITK